MHVFLGPLARTDSREKASFDFILDLDLITAPARREQADDGQGSLW